MEGSIQRVSLDLMGDPDIQNMFQKSYSLEDLTLVDDMDEEDEDDENVEQAQGAIIGTGAVCIMFTRGNTEGVHLGFNSLL